MPFPPDIQYIFRSSNLHYVFPFIERVLTHEELKAIVETAWDIKTKNYPNQSDSQYWLTFLENELQPIINRRLNRPVDFPTMEKIMRLAYKVELERTKHLHIKSN